MSLVAYGFTGPGILTPGSGDGTLKFSSGNIGIGATPGSYKLDVAGSINFTGDLYKSGSLFSTGSWTSTSTGIYYSGGRVGIGTASPIAKLSLSGGSFLQTISTSPTLKSQVIDETNLNGAEHFYISGKYAYIAARNANRLTIVDISNPASPSIVGSVQDATQLSGAFRVWVTGKYAYIVAFSADRLTIVDISNPASPSIVGSVQDATQLDGAEGLYVSGKYAYVGAAFSDYLTIVDISNPASPTIVGSLTNAQIDFPKSVYVSGKYAYIAAMNANRLTIVDISNPASPSIVGSVQDATQLAFAGNVYVSGKYAYVGGSKFAVVDVSNSSSPTVVSSISASNDINDLSVSGAYAYMVFGGVPSGFHIIDVSNPSSPTIVATGTTDGESGVSVSGKYMYTTGGSSGSNSRFNIHDVSGADIPGALIGDISASSLEVTESVNIGDNLYVGSGLNVGLGGIWSAGPLSILSSGTGSLGALDVRNSAGTALLFVRDNGNVGIATTSPAYKLDVWGTGRFTQPVIVGTPSNPTEAATKNYVDTVVSGSWTSTSTGIYYSSGNVGIGTASPNNTIQVANLIDFDNANLNTKLGYQAGLNIVSGAVANTFVGYRAGLSGAASTADGNSAFGYQALFSNTTGSNNTANGYIALSSNTTGIQNTANGVQALYFNTTGSNNTASGYNALFSNTTGIKNTAIGVQALYDLNITNGTGNNTAIGFDTGRGIITGSNNTIIGAEVSGLASNLSNNIIIADGSGNRRINVDNVGKVGIGNTAPAYTLDVTGTFRATGGWSLGGAASTTLNMNGNDIIAVDKLTVTTIDPVYEIDGKKYATYVSDTIGLKTEVYGKAKLSEGKYAIDFGRAERGSDLWLFWQTIDEGADMKDVVVNLTPEFDGRTWYELNPLKRQIIVYGEPHNSLFLIPKSSFNVSYHLAAPRHDAKQWQNILTDSTETGTVLKIR